MSKKKLTDKLHQKRSTVKKHERTSAPKQTALTETGDSFEARIDDSLHLQERKNAKNAKRKSTVFKAVHLLLVMLSLYLAFLIYGAINTQYVYDADGNVVPLVMTLDQIRRLGNFNRLAVQYRQARFLYEQVLVLDFRVAAGLEDPLVIGPEYERLLSSIELLSIQLSAISVPVEFNQTRNMLLTWVRNDIAIYCQNMSSALSLNSQEHAARAAEFRIIMYQGFSIITQNLISLGLQVDGADLRDIMAWSPEQFIQDTLGVFEGG